MNHALQYDIHLHQYLRDKILEEFPDADEETLADTVEGLSTLPEKLAAIVRSQQEDRVLAQALKSRIQEMQERHAAFEARVERKRELVTSVMERTHILKLREADFTASLRQAPAKLVVTEEGEIPEEYWKPQSPKLDRQKLIDHLKANQQIAGAQLSNGGSTLSVRVK